MPKKNIKKQSIFSPVWGLEIKEEKDGNLIRGGYIATTHLDSGFFDEDRELWIKDQIAQETLEHWKTELVSGNPRANKVSVNHERMPHVAGVILKDSVRVDDLGEGHFGLYADHLIDKTKDNFDDTKYRLDKNLLDSFSIEFTTKDPLTGEYLEGAISEEESGKGIIRTLLPGTQLEGDTLASQPMNENCVMIKEVLNKTKESAKMQKKEGEEVKPDVKDPKPDAEGKKVEKEPNGEPTKVDEAEPKPVEATPEEIEEEAKERKRVLSVKKDSEYIKLGKEYKDLVENKERETKLNDEVKSIKERLLKELPKMNKELIFE